MRVDHCILNLWCEWVNLVNLMVEEVYPLKLSGPLSTLAIEMELPIDVLSHVTVSFFWCVFVSQSLLMSLVFLPTSREAGAENWGTEGCQTLTSTTVHTKCLCSRISTYTVLAQQAKDPVSH